MKTNDHQKSLFNLLKKKKIRNESVSKEICQPSENSLLDEFTETYLYDLAKATDIRYEYIDKLDTDFSKEGEVLPMIKEFEVMKVYKEAVFKDEDLTAWNKQYLMGLENQIKSYDQWDENLFQVSIDATAANADRITALSKIHAKYSLDVQYETSKRYLEDYGVMVTNFWLTQKYFETLHYEPINKFGDLIEYRLTGKNTSSDYFETEEGYETTFVLKGDLVDRTGKVVGRIYDEGIKTLLPGQVFSIRAWSEGIEDDLKNYLVLVE